MIELTGRRDSTRNPATRGSTKKSTEQAAQRTHARAEQEIEVICDIIRNGYLLGLGKHSKLSPRERFEFAVRLEEICTIAEWMSRYVEYQEALGRR